KINGIDAVPLLSQVLSTCGEDKVIPNIVWQNLHPLLEDKGDQLLSVVQKADARSSANLALIMPRVIDRILAAKKADPAVVVALLGVLIEGKNANSTAAKQCLAALASKIQTGEVAGAQREALRDKLQPVVRPILDGKPGGVLYVDTAALAACLKDPAGLKI